MSNYQISILIDAQNRATKEIEWLKTQLGSIDKQFKNVDKSIKASWKTITGRSEDTQRQLVGIWATAWVAFVWMRWFINKSVEESNKLTNALTWLKSIVVGTGWDFSKANKFIQEFTSDWLIGVSDAASSLKNLLSRWFGLEEASTIMMRFKDSAAFGRQASLELWEAIKWATEGLKNENSILVDNAGVTKNVSQMWKEYAASIGKGVWELTIAEKRQAEFNGILKETQFQVWDATKLADSYAWAQARLNAETTQAYQAIWAAIQPVLIPMLEVVTKLIDKVTKFATENPKLTGTIIVVATAITGLVVVATSLWLLLPALTTWIAALWVVVWALTWPIGLVILALWALYLAWKTNFWGIQEFTKNTLETFTAAFHWEWSKFFTGMIKITIDSLPLILWPIGKALKNALEMVSQIKNAIRSVGAGGSFDPATSSANTALNIAGARANGWPVNAWSAYLVGEKWPELYMPTRNGTIIPSNNFWWINVNISWVSISNGMDLNNFRDYIEWVIVGSVRNLQAGIY